MPAVTDLPIWTEDGFEIRTQGTVDTTAATYTYNGSLQSYIFRNDGAGSITLTIGGTAVTVVSGEMVAGGALSSFTVQASSGTASWTMRAFELKVAQNSNPSGNVSALLTLQNAATGTGEGTVVDCSGYNTATLDVVISAIASVSYEGSIDGTNWVTTPFYLPNGSANISSSSTVRSIRLSVAGFKFFRARVSSWTSGSVTVTGILSTTTLVPIYPAAQFGNVDTNSPATNNLLGVGGFNLLFDGTNWVRQRAANVSGDGVSLSGGFAPSLLFGSNGTTWDRVKTVNTGQLVTSIRSNTGIDLSISTISSATDGATFSSNGFSVNSVGWGVSGTTSFDRIRVGKIYKWIEFLNLADATATTVWTPAAGRRFRLMGLQISTSAAATVHLRDGAGGTRFHSQRTGGADTKDFNFGNGYLSATANNVLEILNSSGATINVWVTAWGTEE